MSLVSGKSTGIAGIVDIPIRAQALQHGSGILIRHALAAQQVQDTAAAVFPPGAQPGNAVEQNIRSSIRG